jgi:hypothetical protein
MLKFSALTCSLLLAGLAQAGTLEFSSADVDGFSDAGRGRVEREAHVQELARHLQRLAAQGLPANQALKVELLDVDLAGTVRPSSRTGQELRIVRGGADWPKLSLRYTLSRDGQVLRSGEDSLSDLNYSQRGGFGSGSQSLQSEKRLLADWFDSRFGSRHAETR